MIDVKLIAKTDTDPTTLTSHAAKTCYTAKLPEMGSLIDVKERLFKTGHHSTMQHTHFTFSLENLSISSVYLGLFMVAPFYGGSQRSGRFSKMFDNPNIDGIREYLEHFYPGEGLNEALKFVEKGICIYHDNIANVTEITKKLIQEERPFANEKYIETNSPKIAQEQLRMFMSEILPSALDITFNLSSLAALYRVSWSPEMREITDKMAALVVEQHPDLDYIFDPAMRTGEDWFMPYDFKEKATISFKPTLELLDVDIAPNKFVIYNKAKDMVDILPFSPFCMDNSLNSIKTRIGLSMVIVGHDQRHRTIKRSSRRMTGAFYVPPLLKEAGLEETAREYMQDYINLSKKISPMLLSAIVPHGVVITYEKRADLNALIHEQGKRTCWCAQEEIYHLSSLLRQKLKEQDKDGKLEPLIESFAPPCYKNGKCHEGVRYCGRNLKEPKEHYFKNRKI